MDEQPLSAVYHIEITPELLEEAKRSFQSGMDSETRHKQVATGMNRALWSRLCQATTSAMIGIVVYVCASLYPKSPGIINPIPMWFQWLGIAFIAGSPLLALRAIALRFLFIPRRIPTPEAVAERFYGQIFSGDTDWGIAFSYLCPNAISQFSPSPSPEGLKAAWIKERERAKVRVRRSLGPPVRCAKCGKEGNIGEKVGYQSLSGLRSEEFAGGIMEALHIIRHFFRCSKCKTVLCAGCFKHDEPDDRCSICGSLFSKTPFGYFEVFTSDSDDRVQGEAGWSCDKFCVECPVYPSEDIVQMKVYVRLHFSGINGARPYTGTGVVLFHNGAVKSGDSWFLVSGLPGNLKT